MPIKDKSLYPKNWDAISRRIRFERAGGKCEECGMEHGAVGARDREGVWHDEPDIDSMNSSLGHHLFGVWPKIIKVVLTCAHLNHAPGDNRDENLKALCQKCHLSHDAAHHQESAARTRHRASREKSLAAGQQELFEVTP